MSLQIGGGAGINHDDARVAVEGVGMRNKFIHLPRAERALVARPAAQHNQNDREFGGLDAQGRGLRIHGFESKVRRGRAHGRHAHHPLRRRAERRGDQRVHRPLHAGRRDPGHLRRRRVPPLRVPLADGARPGGDADALLRAPAALIGERRALTGDGVRRGPHRLGLIEGLPRLVRAPQLRERPRAPQHRGREPRTPRQHLIVRPERLARVVARLTDQVRKSVRIGDPRKPTGKTPPIIEHFCAALPDVRELLRTDIEAAFEGDPAALLREEIIVSYPFIEAIGIQRLAHLLHRAGAPVIPRMMTEWAHGRTGIDIHPGASIGTHFFIDHGTGVVVGETCEIGNRVKLYHGVTLGARSFAKDSAGHIVKGGKRHPKVEDNVTIYPNSTILGGNTVIGARSTIGANVFLMHSVPANSLVVYEETQLVILDKNGRGKNEELDWEI